MKLLTSALLVMTLAWPAPAQPGIAPEGADPHHPATAGDAPSASPGMMGMMPGMSCPMMGGYTEGVLAFLKTELHITKVQTATWEVFATAYRESSGSRPQMPKTGGGIMEPKSGGQMMGESAKATTPFPDHMSFHMRMMEKRLAALKKMHNAVVPLYAALSAEQKKTADRLLPMVTMMGGMM